MNVKTVLLARKRPVLGLMCLVLMLCSTSALPADETEVATEESEALIERILEIRGELEQLLESLSPEQRAEVERRWLEGTTEKVEESSPLSAQPANPSARTSAVPTAPALTPVEPPAPPVDPPTVPSPVSPTPPEEPPVEPAPSPEFPVKPSEAVPSPEPDAAPALPTPEPAPPPEPRPEAPKGTTRLPVLTRPAGKVEPATCGTLHLLDRNDDGLVSGSDRDWRYLYLLLGGRGSVVERELQRDEVESLFDVGVRSLAVDLREWGGERKTFGDVVSDQTVRLILTQKHKGEDNGALVVDAGRLARSGEIRLVDTATGESLSGLRVFRPGVALETLDGTRVAVPCR